MCLWTLDCDPIQSLSATDGASFILWERAMRSPMWLRFPQLAPCVPTWQTNLPSPGRHVANVTPKICDEVHGHTMSWPRHDIQRLQEASLFLVRGSVPLALYPSLYKVGWILLHTPPIVPPWHHYMVVFDLLWPAMGLLFFSFKTNSLNLFCGTYIRFCLYLNHSSTNLTSLNALPLRTSSRSLYVLGYLVYLSLILHPKFPSPVNISHKI